MPLSTKFLKQDATLWRYKGPDGKGQPTYCPPEPLKVRWDDVQEEFINENGETLVSTASIMVGKDVPFKSMILLQTLDKIKCLDDPRKEGAFEVQKREAYPNLKATDTIRIVTV